MVKWRTKSTSSSKRVDAETMRDKSSFEYYLSALSEIDDKSLTERNLARMAASSGEWPSRAAALRASQRTRSLVVLGPARNCCRRRAPARVLAFFSADVVRAEEDDGGPPPDWTPRLPMAAALPVFRSRLRHRMVRLWIWNLRRIMATDDAVQSFS